MSIGGKTMDEALAALSDMTGGAVAIGKDEHLQRIARAQAFMQANGVAAVYLNAGTNMSYFTGTKWYASERMVGAILPARGALAYIAPAFEESTIQDFMVVEGAVHCGEAPISCSSMCSARWGSRPTPPHRRASASARARRSLLPTVSGRWHRVTPWKTPVASLRTAAHASRMPRSP